MILFVYCALDSPEIDHHLVYILEKKKKPIIREQPLLPPKICFLFAMNFMVFELILLLHYGCKSC